MSIPRFLLITDTHFASEGSPLELDDLSKTSASAIGHSTRENETERLFKRVASTLSRDNRKLDGVLFAGDAQRRGLPGGHQILFDLIMKYFKEHGISPERIVAIPGNHDVKKWSDPGTLERYQAFTEVWKANHCIVPWLDGVHDEEAINPKEHFLVADDHRWIVFPLNTSNWSQIKLDVPPDLLPFWDEIPNKLSRKPQDREKIQKALSGLIDRDMAHISEQQFEALRSVIEASPQPTEGPQLRILLMHHHLRAPSLRVELKSFDNISNLEQVRAFIGQAGINLVVHGHKHEHAVRFEHFGDEQGGYPRRIAVLSAGAIDNGKDTDAARLLRVEGLPFVPELKAERYGLARGGLDLPTFEEPSVQLWSPSHLIGAPHIIEGSDFEEVYARACQAARENVRNGTLIIQLDLAADATQLDLPMGYPETPGVSAADRRKWLHDIVDWWQLPQSRRDKNFPYPHGSRLRRYGGVVDQIERLGKMLEAARSSATISSRALAVLVDPIRDFSVKIEEDDEAFPSFTALQIKKRMSNGIGHLDVIGIYRAQEFSQWWPVNMAELRSIQTRLCARAGLKTGRITTITTEARFDEKAPGQVHVPIFDRWLDQAPQNLFLLASLLVGSLREHSRATELIDQWRQALDDFLVVARAPNTDGSPISSQGLKSLADYIAALCGDGEMRPPFFSSLQALVEQCQAFESAQKGAHRFEVWATAVKRIIPEIKTASEQTLSGAMPSG